MTTARHARPFNTAAMSAGLPPLHGGTLLLEKAFGSELLTRDERDAIARKMYGPCSQHASVYKEMGWLWNMADALQLTRFLVSLDHEAGRFHTFYAGDEAALRSVLEDVHEIVSAPLPLK